MLQQKQANKQMNNFVPLLQLVSGYPCYLFPGLFQERNKHLADSEACCGNFVLVKTEWKGFSGGSVVKNMPANAGDTGLISGPGGSHMPQSS